MSLFGSLFARYVFRQSAGAVLLILLSLSGVVWIALALRQLNLMTTQGQEAWMFIKMTLLALPNLMALVAPIALLVAVIHVLNRLNGDSELIVVTASGATVWHAARPLLFLALLVSLAVSAVNHFVMPWSLRLLREYVVQVRTDLITQVIQPGRFSSPERDLTFHIRERSLDGELLGLVMHDARDEAQVVTFLAERGHIIKQDDNAYLLMETGHILRRTSPKEPVQIIAFDRYAVDLARFEQKEESTVYKPRERYYSELAYPEPDDWMLRNQPGQLRAELHERLSSPLYPFAFVLIAIAFVGQAQTTRQNRMESIVMAFLLAAGLRLAGLAGTNLVSLRASAIPIVYLLPITAIVLSTIAAQRRMRPHQSSRVWQALMGAGELIGALVSSLWGRLTMPAWVRRLSFGSSSKGILRRYVARRFLLTIGATFMLCAILIFMIDIVELLRQAGKYGRVPTSDIAWMAILRLPAYTEILLPFCALAGSIGALLFLGRKSELIVMRAAGMSVWQFLAPGLMVAFLVGVLAAVAWSPLAANARAESERLFAEAFGREATVLKAGGSGAWLRQDGTDGASVINAGAAGGDGRTLFNLIVIQFDTGGHFAERVDAEKATLLDGHWRIDKAQVARVGREPENFDTYTVSTFLAPERVADALGAAMTLSFWELPGLIEVAEKAGLSAARFRVQYELLLSRPLLLMVTVLLAATVSLRSFRGGGIQIMVIAGMLGGFSFFLLSEVSRQIGIAGFAPPMAAVWLPVLVACFGSLTVLLHQEDG
jgi:LPS export ABC transporter permease LptG/LPS export ABC transporter permease LptF